MSKKSSSAPSPIEDIFAFCEAHPVAHISPRWFVAQLSSGLPAIVDRRDMGIVGLLLDHGIPTAGALHYEIIGGTLDAKNSLDFFSSLLMEAGRLGFREMEIRFPEKMADMVVPFLLRRGGALAYKEGRLHCPMLQGKNRILPEGWYWKNVGATNIGEYEDLRRVSFQGIPGIVLVPFAGLDFLRSHKTRFLFAPDGLAGALRLNRRSGLIAALMRHPRYRARGVGSLLLDEAARLLGKKEAKLDVVDCNLAALRLYREYGFIGDPNDSIIYVVPTGNY